MLCLVSPDEMVPLDHPLRLMRPMVEEALSDLSPVFDEMYSTIGRPSIPPEWLLKASLLMAFYSVRSERLFCEQLRYNMLFRWFLAMDMTTSPFDASTFSKNRERLMDHDVAGLFFRRVVDQAQRGGFMSDEHFSVDGTLIEAWASMKSFRPKDEPPEDDPRHRGGTNGWVDFKGQKRSNATHESRTDPEAKLARKGNGQGAKLSFSAHALTENRNGLLADVRIEEANGHAERDTALEMLKEVAGQKRITVGADRGYDAKDFVAACRRSKVTPHVAQKRYSAIDKRTTRHESYRISQRVRKRIEEVFGWFKTVAGLRRTRYRGLRRTQLAAYLIGAAYNLLRISKLKWANDGG